MFLLSACSVVPIPGSVSGLMFAGLAALPRLLCSALYPELSIPTCGVVDELKRLLTPPAAVLPKFGTLDAAVLRLLRALVCPGVTLVLALPYELIRLPSSGVAALQGALDEFMVVVAGVLLPIRLNPYQPADSIAMEAEPTTSSPHFYRCERQAAKLWPKL